MYLYIKQIEAARPELRKRALKWSPNHWFHTFRVSSAKKLASFKDGEMYSFFIQVMPARGRRQSMVLINIVEKTKETNFCE